VPDLRVVGQAEVVVRAEVEERFAADRDVRPGGRLRDRRVAKEAVADEVKEARGDALVEGVGRGLGRSAGRGTHVFTIGKEAVHGKKDRKFPTNSRFT
jgi:hypothetical protein